MTPPSSPSRAGRAALADDDDDDDEQHSPEWHLWPPTTRRLPPALALALALYGLHARASRETAAPVAAAPLFSSSLAPPGWAGAASLRLGILRRIIPCSRWTDIHLTPSRQLS